MDSRPDGTVWRCAGGALGCDRRSASLAMRFTDRHKSASANRRGSFLALGSWLPYASAIVGLTWVSSWLIGRLVVNDAAAGSLGALAVTLIVKLLDKVPGWVEWLRPWRVGKWAIQKRYGARFKSNRGTDIFGNGYRAVWIDPAALAYPNPIVIRDWYTSARKDRYAAIGAALRSSEPVTTTVPGTDGIP